MNINVNLVINIVLCIILVTSFSVLVAAIVSLLNSKKKLIDNEIALSNYIQENKNCTVEYTKSVMEFIKTFSTQICILRFKEFINSKDSINKVTRESIKHLIDDVAKEVYSSINWENIDTDNMHVDKNKFHEFIIHTVMYDIQQLFEKEIK